jgi:hypothetical protein
MGELFVEGRTDGYVDGWKKWKNGWAKWKNGWADSWMCDTIPYNTISHLYRALTKTSLAQERASLQI